MPAIQLSIVVAQYDRDKHPRALAGLLDALDRMPSADPFVAVVDNARPGDWTHRGGEGIVHVGGDGWAREFSAFDRGLSVLEEMGRKTDVFVLVTDSLPAYGENILGYVDDRALACCHRLHAGVGWVDTWGEGCRIGDLDFDAWLRTCFVLLPAPVLEQLRPLAADLAPLRLFEEGSNEPFAPGAQLSARVRQCLVEWLTTEPVSSPHLRWHWHSRFDLTPVTRPFFQAKASAILREQLLSARLRKARVPCYGLRCIRRLAERGELEAFFGAGGNAAYEWLGGLTVEEAQGAARRAPAARASSPPIPASPRPAPVFLLEAEPGDPQSRRAAAYFRSKVLPLIRQRFAGARLAVAGPGAAGSAGGPDGGPRVVIRLNEDPGGSPETAGGEARASGGGDEPGPGPLASLSLEGANGAPAREVLVDTGSPPRIARLCCRLLEAQRR